MKNDTRHTSQGFSQQINWFAPYHFQSSGALPPTFFMEGKYSIELEHIQQHMRTQEQTTQNTVRQLKEAKYEHDS